MSRSKKPLAALGLFVDSLHQPFLWPPIVSLRPSGEVIQKKSIFPQLQNVQTVTGKRKKYMRTFWCLKEVLDYRDIVWPIGCYQMITAFQKAVTK